MSARPRSAPARRGCAAPACAGWRRRCRDGGAGSRRKWRPAANPGCSSAGAPPRCPKPQPAGPVAGDHAVLSFATGAGTLARCDRQCGAEPGLGRGNASRFTLAETHKQPHLAIGDVATGQGAVPHRREEPASYPAGRDRQTTRPFQGRAVRRIRNVSRATPSCRRASGDSFSSRLTRASHPVCRAANEAVNAAAGPGEVLPR